MYRIASLILLCSLVVAPPVSCQQPTLSLEVAERAEVGNSYVLSATLSNPGRTALDVKAAVVVRVSSSDGSQGTARFVSRNDGLRVARPAQVHAIHVDGGGARPMQIDLAATTFTTNPPARRLVGLFDLVRGDFDIAVRIEDAAGKVLASKTTARSVAPLGISSTELKLRVERATPSSTHPRVRVVLANEGKDPVQVPSTLAWPRHVFFSFTSEGTRTSVRARPIDVKRAPGHGLPSQALIARGFSWDPTGFDPFVRGSAETFVLLPPGGSLSRTFDLRDLLAQKGAFHGAMKLRAYWRNRDDGRRLGLPKRLVVGLVASDPLSVRGRAW